MEETITLRSIGLKDSDSNQDIDIAIPVDLITGVEPIEYARDEDKYRLKITVGGIDYLWFVNSEDVLRKAYEKIKEIIKQRDESKH